jgi:hypothetical protein
MNTALEYSTRVVQEGGRRCKKSTGTLNDLVQLTPLRIPLMNPPIVAVSLSSNLKDVLQKINFYDKQNSIPIKLYDKQNSPPIRIKP